MAPLSLRLLLGAIAVASGLRWPSLGDGEVARWPISFLLWGLALVFVLRHPAVWATLLRRPTVFLVAFGTWAMIASRWSPIQPSSFALGFGVFVLIIFCAAYVDRYGWQSFAAVIAVSMALFIAAGWAYALLSEDPDAGMASGRLTGLSHNPTNLGLLAAIMGLTAVSGFRGQPRRVAALVAFACPVLYLTNARMASLAFALALLLVLVGSTHGLRRAMALGGMAIGACLLLVVILAGDTVTPSLARGDHSDELQSLTGRTGLWDLSDGWIAEAPLFGHGTQAASQLFGEAQARGDLTWPARDAHNTIVHSLLELGLIGALLLVAFTTTYILATIRTPDPRALAPAFAVMIVGVTESLTHEPTVALLVLAAAGAHAGRSSSDGVRAVAAVVTPRETGSSTAAAL